MNHSKKDFVLLTLTAFILLIAAAAGAAANNQVEIYASAEGRVNNKGTKDSPLTFKAALLKAGKLLKSKGLPSGGLTVYLRGGEYKIDTGVKLGSEFKGTEKSPIIIRNYPGETVIFDGAKKITPTGFSKVKAPGERALLAKTAKDKILVKAITDKSLIKKLNSRILLNLGFNNDIYLPSCYPNSGYAMLKEKYAVKEVSPPAIPRVLPKGIASRAGQKPWREPGKPNAWKGSITEPRGAQVGIGKKEDQMAGSWKQWANEINKNNTRNLLSGFISADWLLESHPIYAANAEQQTIHLSRVTAYGWHGPKHKRKNFKVYGLLCELDTPGEWHFDNQTNRFYIYPPEPLDQNTQMGFPYAKNFLELKGTEYVSVIGINVRNVGSGTVMRISSGKHNLIAGCNINNCTATGISIAGGMYNGASGCDLVDLNSHVGLSGGTRSPTEITAAYNYVENCHIYQVKFYHAKVGINMSGVGNIFSNNLIHNSIGQAMQIRGNDLLMERNEFFNIGYDEGDGGAMYSGADLAGYGNTYRHNFIHHLIHVPGKVARAGIHLDDHQAGSVITENIFYKSAEKGIFMNGGSGHVVRRNVLLEGSLGIYNVSAGSKLSYDRQQAISANPDHDLKGNKEDYIGRAEKVVGKNGWKNEPWKSRYPRFALVMNDTGENGRMWPIRCVIEGNLYYGNGRGNKTEWSRFSPESRAKSIISNEKLTGPEDFADYESLDLRFRKPSANVPAIPFEKIGLFLDEYRTSMPDKTHYRMAVKDFFKDVKSMPGTTKQINTGKVVESGPVITAKAGIRPD